MRAPVIEGDLLTVRLTGLSDLFRSSRYMSSLGF